jgi:hypothetical protein
MALGTMSLGTMSLEEKGTKKLNAKGAQLPGRQPDLFLSAERELEFSKESEGWSAGLFPWR